MARRSPRHSSASRSRQVELAQDEAELFVVPPGGGDVEREIELEDPEVTNVCFGGPDFRTLFVTQASLGRIVTLDWDVPGMRLFPDRGW